MRHKRMIGPGAGKMDDLHLSSRLPRGSTYRVQKRFFGNESRARAGHEQAARRDREQGEAIHVEIFFESERNVFAVARLLGGVEQDNVKTLSGRKNIAQPSKEVGLRELDAHL